MPTKANVIAGIPNGIGAIFRAPLGTPIPVDARTPLGAAFKELGYASSDGWTRQINKKYEAVNAWGGDEVHKSRSEHSVGFEVSLIEDLNVEAQTAKWGTAAVKRTAATTTAGNLVTVSYAGAETDPGVWVFDMNDQGVLHRTVFPYAKDTTEKFEQKFEDKSVIELPFECTAYKDATTGLYFVDYTDDGKKTA